MREGRVVAQTEPQPNTGAAAAPSGDAGGGKAIAPDVAWLREALEGSSSPILLVAASGSIVLANPAAQGLFGYSQAELEGMAIDQLVPHDARAEHGPSFADYFARPRLRLMGSGLTLRARCRDGSELPVEIALVPLRVGGEVQVAALVRDVSERLRVEQRLQRSEERFRRLVESNIIGMLIAGTDGSVLEANDAFLDIIGYTREDLAAGRVRWDAITPDEDRERDRCAVEDLRRRGFSAPWEKRYVRKDGSLVPVLVGIAAADTALTTAVAFVLDLSVRKGLEQALEARAREATAIAQLGQHALRDADLPTFLDRAVATVARTLDVEYATIADLLPGGDALRVRAGVGWQHGVVGSETVGTSGEDHFGYTFASSRAVTVEDLRCDSRFSGPALLKRHGVVSGAAVVIPGRDRPFGILAAHSQRVVLFSRENLDFLQQVANLVGRLADHERDQAALRASEERLRQVQRLDALGQLAGGVAHDFNNLLTVILGSVELGLRAPAIGSDARASFEEIKEAAIRARELTAQLLAFSRRHPNEPRVLDASAVVRDLAGMLGRLIGESIELETELAPAPTAVRGDPALLEQVIVNLAVNARDAMPEGGRLTIATRHVELGSGLASEHGPIAQGRWVCVEVRDTGCGIDPTIRGRLFEPFFTTKPPGKGTGLGLATVYGIVAQAEGHLIVESAPGKGSTFRVLLRAVEATPAATAEPEPRQLELHGDSAVVLVVEDEASLRGLTCRLLAALGHAVIEASCGEEALRLSESYPERIDLLLTDVVMPGMSGGDLALQLRRFRPELRVVLSSGYGPDAATRQVQRRLGATWLHKPFTPLDLASSVHQALTDEPGDGA